MREDDRAAVRVGNEAALNGNSVVVHAGDDQRHIGVHAERVALVHNRAARIKCQRDVPRAQLVADAEQRRVIIAEVARRKVLHRELALSVRDRPPCAGRAGEATDFLNVSSLAGNDLQETLPNKARRACDGYPQTHYSSKMASRPITRPLTRPIFLMA